MKLDRYYMKDEEYYEGEFYEDDGHGLYGPDCSGWTVNHKPGLEGMCYMFDV
jgi:hypothetical protein